MRAANFGNRGRVQNRPVDRPDLQLDPPGVVKLLSKRNFVPFEPRKSHVDGGDQRRLALPAIQPPGAGFDRKRGLTALLEQNVRYAAHAVAASAGLGTVIVENAHKSVGMGRAWRIDRHQLIIRNPSGSRTSVCGGNMDPVWAHSPPRQLRVETRYFYRGSSGEKRQAPHPP